MINFIFKAIIRDFSQYLLATIGLILGITSLIAMGYLGVIGKIKLYKEIEKQGVNIIYIYPENAKKTVIRKTFSGTYPSIKDKEIEYISSTPFGAEKSIGVKFFSGSVANGKNSIKNVEIVGSKGNYIKFFHYYILKSVPNIKGCYIGYTIFKELFNEDLRVIGRNINISGQFLKIKGVLKEKGASSSGRDLDKIIVVPLEIFSSKFSNKDYFDAVYVKPYKINIIKSLKSSIIFLLRSLNKNTIFPLKEFEFSVRSMDYYLKKQERVGRLMVISTFIVSSITLLVGGIGVMAIMIILSIKETRDIGIKRAIGATKLNIFFEYIMKSLFIEIISSIIGFCLGWISYFLINNIYGISTIFPYKYAIAGIVSSFIIAIIFGIYPAYKASKIEPSIALHYQ